MNQVKDSAKKALDQLDNTEYTALKESLAGRLDETYQQIKVLQSAVSPVTDSVVSTIAEATADFRNSVIDDINTLKVDLEPKRVALQEVLDRHIEQYRLALGPIINEYSRKSTANMEAMKAELEPIVEEMRAKVAVNVEETKAALIDIVEAVRAKFGERLESLRLTVSPYVEEYKEQMKQAYNQAQSIKPEDLAALKEKITPMAEDIKAKITAIANSVADLFSKN